MKTKMDATTFFSSNNQHIHKLVHHAPSGLKRHQVEEAAVLIFTEISEGREILLKDIPQEVWDKAHGLSGKEYKVTWAQAINSTEKIRRLVKRTRDFREKVESSQAELKQFKIMALFQTALLLIYFTLKFTGFFI